MAIEIKAKPRRLRFTYIRENIFKHSLNTAALIIISILVMAFLTIIWASRISIAEIGISFLYGTSWDPVFEEFGALPFITGTLLTSGIAIIISTPIAIAIAILLNEYINYRFIMTLVKSAVDLLAGIPSVVYGFWAINMLVPWVQKMQLALDIAPYGVGIFSASIILAIMIIPYSASIAYEVMGLIPQSIKEAAYATGATRYEAIKTVLLPYARTGIFSGILLALGRALGETMAVTMVIGNANRMPDSIFSPANTIASAIANEFAEAIEPVYLSSLVELGLLLFIITALFSVIGQMVIKKWSHT